MQFDNSNDRHGHGPVNLGQSKHAHGWASGSFGLFGLHAEPITIPAWNYAGVSLALVGLALFLQVEPNDDEDQVGDVTASTGTYKSLSSSDSFTMSRMHRTKSYNSIARTTSSGFWQPWEVRPTRPTMKLTR